MSTLYHPDKMTEQLKEHYRFIEEMRDGIKVWMESQRMLGDFLVHFQDDRMAWGYIEDPKGHRWVHVFIQDEFDERKFSYREANIRPRPRAVITILDKEEELKRAEEYNPPLQPSPSVTVDEEARIANARQALEKTCFLDALEHTNASSDEED